MIDGQTQLIGLIGHPVAHSFSPAMHNAAAAALKLNITYVPLPVSPERLPEALRGLVALGFRGFNVTVPHKEAVLPYLDAIFPAARIIGAVNTVVVGDNGRLIGFNTDWSGFLTDLESRRQALFGRDCLVLGAGGSARAVVYALLRRGSRVTVLSRRPEQAQRLVTELGAAFPDAMATIASLDEVAHVAAHHDEPILINTTPLGMAGAHAGQSPWPDGAPFPPGAFVYDLVYNPRETPFMAQALAAGRPAVNGLGMLVQQAVEAFEVMTGRRPDPAVMRRAIGG